MRSMIVQALQKKLGAGSDSLIVLIHQLRRQYPLQRELANKIIEVDRRIGANDKPSKKEIDDLIKEIKSI